MNPDPGFGRLEPGPDNSPLGEINMTPLIDVMLVLLVIFILTAPLLVQRLQVTEVRVASPAPAPVLAQPAFLEITLNQAGDVWVAGQAQTRDGLLALLQATAQAHPDAEVRLRADARLPYGRVAELMALAQGAGLRRVAFLTDTP